MVGVSFFSEAMSDTTEGEGGIGALIEIVSSSSSGAALEIGGTWDTGIVGETCVTGRIGVRTGRRGFLVQHMSAGAIRVYVYEDA